APEFATQTEPEPKVIPAGFAPTGIGRPSLLPLLTSSRDTVPSSRFATHAEPPPIATATGLSPTVAVVVTRFVRGSTRAAKPGAELTVHTVPAPTATSDGVACARRILLRLNGRGSILTRTSSSAAVDQTAPPPTASPRPPSPTSGGCPSVVTLRRGSIRWRKPAFRAQMPPFPAARSVGAWPTRMRAVTFGPLWPLPPPQ